MELRQIKYFLAVAKTLNFSTAANALCITQGTLSQQIKQLEDEMGTPLFNRSSHKVSLTEAGEEMLPLAKQTLTASAECFQRISDLKKGVAGTLNIGLTASFRGIVNEAMKKYIKEYPGVKIQIMYGTSVELLHMLREHEIDFFLAFKPATFYEDLESLPLMETELSAVMSKDHPLADKDVLTLKDLERQRIVLPGAGMQARKAFDRHVDMDTSGLNICVEINNPHGIIELVHCTKLIAIVSSLATYYDPSLKAIPVEGLRRRMTGSVHWLKEYYLKKSAVIFIDILKETVKLRY